ncbi:MAG: POTRA domain-containing protein [Acidobacteriota bacterium]
MMTAVQFPQTLRVLLTLLFFALPPPPLQAEGETGAGPVIRDVEISGTTRAISIETREGQILDRKRIGSDVKSLWQSGWFDDIRVEGEPADNGVKLRFILSERERYRLRRIRCQPRPFELREVIPAGTWIDQAMVTVLAKRFQSSLRDAGYLDARVSAQLIPVQRSQADAVFRVEAGQLYLVKSLEFTGIPQDLVEASWQDLRDLKSRTVIPGIPGLWRGWKFSRAYRLPAVERALQKVRSRLIASGYLEATTRLSRHDIENGRVSLQIEAQPGPLYLVESAQPTRLGETAIGKQAPPTPLQDLCRCLLEERRAAEKRGIVDFDASLFVEPRRTTVADHLRRAMVSYQVETGNPVRVGRIEFRGHHQFGDSTLRKNLLLAEGDPFNLSLLHRSLIRLNQTGLIHPIGQADLEIERGPTNQVLNVTIPIREKDRGWWLLSAPAWLGLSRTASLSIGSRLPDWGPPGLELPTYFAAFSLSHPLLGLPLLGHRGWQPSFSLARAYLPAEKWRSGFHIPLQASWKQAALNSSLIQVRSHLRAPTVLSPDLAVAIQWEDARSSPFRSSGGSLLCEPSPSRWVQTWPYVQALTDWVLPVIGF